MFIFCNECIYLKKVLLIFYLTKSLTGSIVGNDISKQRFTRLKKVVKQYVPKDSRTKIKLVNLDGRLWDEVEVSSYDKVCLIG